MKHEQTMCWIFSYHPHFLLLNIWVESMLNSIWLKSVHFYNYCLTTSCTWNKWNTRLFDLRIYLYIGLILLRVSVEVLYRKMHHQTVYLFLQSIRFRLVYLYFKIFPLHKRWLYELGISKSFYTCKITSYLNVIQCLEAVTFHAYKFQNMLLNSC